MAELVLRVADRAVSASSPASGLVQSNVSVDTMTAAFDGDWDGATVYVTFSNGDEAVTQQYSDGMTIPWEVLSSSGSLYVTFAGYFSGDESARLVTRIMSSPVKVNQSGDFEGAEPTEASEDALQQLTEAAALASDAAYKANAAAANANVATTATRDAATSIMNAISEITDSYLSETASGIVDTLARNSCTSGMYVDGTWYVDSSDVDYADGILTVEGASYSGGYMLLPTGTCCAAEALSTAQRAEEEALEASRLASYNSSSVEDLMAQIEALQAMVDVLALNASTYPFVLGTTMYVRGVSYASGILTVPTASYSGGYMLISEM